MPHVDAVGVAVQYVEHGASAQQAEHHLVVLPGFGLDHRSVVAAFEPVFSERPGWRRLYVDYPGVGGTQAPEWVDSTDAVFQVVAAAVDALVPDRVVLGGGLLRRVPRGRARRVPGHPGGRVGAGGPDGAAPRAA